MDVTKQCLVAEGWCPVFATNQIQNTLQRDTNDNNSRIGAIFQVLRTKELPPTCFRTNKFTSAFQEIVDAYGYFMGQNIIIDNFPCPVEIVLLLLALVAVPWMLFPKPFLLKKHQGQSYAPLDSSDPFEMEQHIPHSNEEFEFSEVFVHQLIHTIEFVLGAVSNMASDMFKTSRIVSFGFPAAM
ncbi:hypothetical protein JRO89_XS07G0029800 [Xanthoceras sorbifolium]|uniref:V-type proton ATPase subunit a n=1 Tax=Xanthoceras sorbifolium TaxID=99658 RepID=A0ABQ8HS51_9ROSI|nr:hypothetical protein JRO89_XS07G0029800 [Xanthoceras sorbifolium]